MMRHVERAFNTVSRYMTQSSMNDRRLTFSSEAVGDHPLHCSPEAPVVQCLQGAERATLAESMTQNREDLDGDNYNGIWAMKMVI